MDNGKLEEDGVNGEGDRGKLLEGMAVLDFDMLCSTVVLQNQQGKWRILDVDEDDDDDDEEEEERNGAVSRMWEGQLFEDCFDNRRIAIQSTCCPCYRFGKNMGRAGFGSCFLQGTVHFVLVVSALINIVAFVVTQRNCFLYLAVCFTVSIGAYLGFFRSQIKKKFNIRVGDSLLDDFAFHLICPSCTLSQEARTLEMNNVQDGTWHGRGDTICVGSYNEGSKLLVDLHPPEPYTMPKFGNLSSKKIYRTEITRGEEALVMTVATTHNPPPARPQGKSVAIVVCFFLGLGSLVAWNSMLTISDYYYQLFPKYHPSKVLTLVYQPFANVTMVILAIYESKLNTRKRNIAGFILFTASTFGLIVLDLATSGKGGAGPYIGICALVACFGIADAHVQGGIMGDLSFMCPEFIQSFLAGLAASGALTSGLRLVTKAVFDKQEDGQRKGTLLFLSISTAFEFACIFLYAYVFPKLQIVKQYRLKAAAEGSKTVSADLAIAGIQTAEGETEKRLGKIELFRQNWDYLLDIYLIYVFTLSIFPGFIFENTGSNHQLGSWYPLVLIALYNVWDLISRYIPLIGFLKLENRKALMCCVLSRFLLVPAFYFAGKYAGQGWMMLLTSFMGLTNGYLTVCVLTIAPKGYKGPEQNALGNLLVLFLLAGIFSGVALDWLWDL
ncbi:hypothetical protein ACFE04_000745 [Oxalis oulophora]